MAGAMITRDAQGTEYGWDSDGIESTRLTYSTASVRQMRLDRIGTLPEVVLRLLDRLARLWAVLRA